MPMIQVPVRFTKFFLEFDSWNNRWQSFAMIEMRDIEEFNATRWYNGIGANPDLASKELIHNINNGITVESNRDKHRIEELQKQTKSRGFRSLEKVKNENKTYEETKKELKDLF